MELMEEGEAVLFVDDHPDNCLNVREAFPESEVWLMSRPFNHEFEHPKVTRAQTGMTFLRSPGCCKPLHRSPDPSPEIRTFTSHPCGFIAEDIEGCLLR